MGKYIDPSRVTVIKDSDGTAQSKLDLIFNSGQDIYSKYYYSSNAETQRSKQISIYFKTDKPVYLSSFDYDMRTSINTGISVYLYGYGTDDTFSNSNYTGIGSYSITSRVGSENDYTYKYNIRKDYIQRHQYFKLTITQDAFKNYGSYVHVSIFKISLYGEPFIPKYILKDSTNGYYYTKDNNVFMQKEDITEDKLMDDINEMTKENLELINGPYRALRILVP